MTIKGFAKRYFPGVIDLRNRIYNDMVHYRFKNKLIERVFSEIYKENLWNDDQSKSGTGSTYEQTAKISSGLKKLVHELKIKTLLDIPCGDFNWMKKIDLGDCHYYGADIVKELIDYNNVNYSKHKCDFF